MANKEAIDAFVGELREAEQYLDKIKEQILNHLDSSPEEVNWGHVGSAGHVKSELKNICEFLQV